MDLGTPVQEGSTRRCGGPVPVKGAPIFEKPTPSESQERIKLQLACIFCPRNCRFTKRKRKSNPPVHQTFSPHSCMQSSWCMECPACLGKRRRCVSEEKNQQLPEPVRSSHSTLQSLPSTALSQGCRPTNVPDKFGGSDIHKYNQTSSLQENTPPFGGVLSFTYQRTAGGYIASEPPSPSGHGPLPRPVIETPILCKTGTFHFTIQLLEVEKKQRSRLIVLNGQTQFGQDNIQSAFTFEISGAVSAIALKV